MGAPQRVRPHLWTTESCELCQPGPSPLSGCRREEPRGLAVPLQWLAHCSLLKRGCEVKEVSLGLPPTSPSSPVFPTDGPPPLLEGSQEQGRDRGGCSQCSPVHVCSPAGLFPNTLHNLQVRASITSSLGYFSLFLTALLASSLSPL